MSSDSPRVFDAGRGESIFFEGRPLYSGENPAARAADKARRIELKANTLYLLPAPLLWYGIPELLDRAPAETRFLAVEVVPDLLPLTEARQPKRFTEDSRCRLLRAPSEHEVLQTLYETDIQQLRRCELLSLNAGYRMRRGEYNRLAELLQGEIELFWRHKATLVHMMPLWIRNVFFNLALHRSGVRPTISVGTPIMVIGAGPSLDEHIELIGELRNAFFLLAVDTAYAPLRSAGIRPDMVILQEGQFYNQYDFLPHPDLRCSVLADMSSHAGVLRRLTGGAESYTLFFTEFTASSLFRRLQKHGLLPPMSVPPLGSVGSAAVFTALHLTAREVLVCGVDFAFPEGRTHARGAPSHLAELLAADRFRPPTGELVRTKHGIRALQAEIKEVEKGGSSGGNTAVYTAPVIDSYVKSFTRRFSGEERLGRLGAGRSDMRLRQVGRKELRRIASAAQDSRGAGTGGRDVESTSPPSAEQVRSFLEQERELLHECYRIGRKLLHGRGGEEEQERLTELLRSADYLYLYFPDTGTKPPELSPNMLKRLLVSAGRFSRLLDRALQIIL